MTSKFLQKNLWDKITTLAKSSKHKYVAVAYLGTGATKLLPLRKGNTLVVDLRLETVQAGQVNPFEIEKYLRRGVDVYAYTNLHSKVFVFDRTAIVGSANVSNRSKKTLIESGVLLTDSDVVNTARGFVKTLLGAPVTPQYVKSLKRSYRLPRIGDGKRKPYPRLWVVQVELGEFDKREKQAAKSGETVAERKIKDKKAYTVEEVIYDSLTEIAKRASFGDLVIQVYSENSGIPWVYPPSRIVHIKQCTNSDGLRERIIFTEEPRNPKRRTLQVFKAALKKYGILYPRMNMTQEIRDAEEMQALLGLWITHHSK